MEQVAQIVLSQQKTVKNKVTSPASYERFRFAFNVSHSEPSEGSSYVVRCLVPFIHEVTRMRSHTLKITLQDPQRRTTPYGVRQISESVSIAAPQFTTSFNRSRGTRCRPRLHAKHGQSELTQTCVPKRQGEHIMEQGAQRLCGGHFRTVQQVPRCRT